MRLSRPTHREACRLWLAIGITITLSLYRLTGFLAAEIHAHIRPYFATAVEQCLSEFLFFWLLLLLWLAYRQWHKSTRREEELETIISSINPDALIVVSPDRTIEVCSNAVERMFGYSASEVLNRKTDLLYFDRKMDGRHCGLFESLREFGFHLAEATGRHKDGRTFPVELITAELKGRAGAVELIRDITDRRRLEECRDNLLHMIVHDLKTPLAAIDGYLQMLIRRAGQTLDDEKLSYLREASGLVWDQLAMIDTLLDISRLESSEMPLTFADCDMEELVDEAIKRVADAADRHPIRFERPSESVCASCDRGVIRRVLINLLENAAKFSPNESEIRVGVARQTDAIAVSVTDRGHGIAQEHWERIFERFGQAPDQAGRPHSAGLGLTFCKLAVEAHGGRIGVESEVGKGSTFRFTLRPAPATMDPPGR